MESIFYLGYISTASSPYEESQYRSILEKSRENNHKRGITGILVYIDGTILQILEGNKNNIDQLYQTISADHRHRAITKILEGYSKERNFTNWAMGFKKIPVKQLKNNEEIFFTLQDKDFQNLKLNNPENPLYIFLKSFYLGDI